MRRNKKFRHLEEMGCPKTFDNHEFEDDGTPSIT